MKEVKRKSTCDRCKHWFKIWDDINNEDYEYCTITNDTEKLKYKKECDEYEEE